MPQPYGAATHSLDALIIEKALAHFESIRFKEIIGTQDDAKIAKLVHELRGASNFSAYLIAQFTERS